MAAFSATDVISFILVVVLQIVMLTLMPLSKGYTILWPTLGAIAAINIAMWLLARIVASGAQLSILIPISATVIPLSVIAVGIFVYGEPAPVLKIVLLVVASLMIGVASGLR
jgi:multidrug transporter EmrE-like cation transporter